ncbi:putative cytochrome c oxidase assembly protein Cox19 [Chytriomyces cf. hyalinus JEL632]|nr:putative cytochrome c oxidase assembly protein Cox19 [Chytriomyces cf. hyalinus JEL632]
MSMGNNFQRTSMKSIPPERGAFPLDLGGQCKASMEAYMACMKQQRNGDHSKCRDLSREYIQCRMNSNLMEQDRMDNLGFDAPSASTAPPSSKPAGTHSS